MDYENDESIIVPKGKEGIGGWLLVFMVFLFAYMFFILITIFSNLYAYLSVFNNLIFFEKLTYGYSLLLSILSFILSILVFIQLIRKNMAGKYAVIIFLFFNIYMQASNLVTIVGLGIYELIIATLFGIIWIVYFNKSKRIENTLVNETECKWVSAVGNIGGGIMAVGYIGGIAFHIYTVILIFKIYGITGLVISFFLPVISEIFMFVKAIHDTGTFYTAYCVLAAFYLITTFGMSITLSYVGDRMEKDGF